MAVGCSFINNIQDLENTQIFENVIKNWKYKGNSEDKGSPAKYVN